MKKHKGLRKVMFLTQPFDVGINMCGERKL